MSERVAKVLHVIPSISLAHGGPSRAIRLIEQALRGHALAIETATTDDDGPGRRLAIPLNVAITEGGNVRRYFHTTLGFYKVSTSLAGWLFRHVRDYDIVHIHALFSFSSTVSAWAARRAGVPYVVRPLGTLTNYGMNRRRPLLKRLSLALVEGPILRHAAAVHFTSEMERAEAASLGIAMRAAIIPLAVESPPPTDVETLLSSFSELRGREWVVYLSRLDPKKNVEGLLRAIASCVAEFPEVRWLLAGEGDPDYVSGLHDLARKLGLEKFVLWSGHLQGDQKAAALAHAKLFVLPSYSENFGIAAVEAMHAGLPVVLGKGVALSSLVASAGAGIAVDPEPEAIALALRFYLLDPHARVQAGAKAKALAIKEFSLDTMGARLAGLYETILSAPDRNWPGVRQ